MNLSNNRPHQINELSPGLLSRRQLLAGASAGLLAPIGGALAAQDKPVKNKFCAFVKFLQSLSYEDLAETIARMGFDGIEATVRNGGQIEPEQVEDELPKLVEALSKHDLEISVMASSVNSVDQPLTEKVLATAAKLGVPRYRMAYYRYDLSRPVSKQIEELRPVVADLAALNRQLGIQAVYQNHSGSRIVGAPMWDIYDLFERHSPDEMAVAFDIRHATVEGAQAWPIHFNLLRPMLGAVYIKDFRFAGRRPENVPLGEGQVDPAFAKRLKESNFAGPISLHVEYLPKASVEENVKAIERDFATLQSWL